MIEGRREKLSVSGKMGTGKTDDHDMTLMMTTIERTHDQGIRRREKKKGDCMIPPSLPPPFDLA